jgi:hypothetical protein
MRHKLSCASCMIAAAVIGAAPAYADTDHGIECNEGGATSYPGNSATSPGSIFNEPEVNSTSGGKGNQAYDTNARQGAGAPSQYDVACGRVTANGTGTGYQVTQPVDPKTGLPTPDGQFVNNSRASREAIGVSHVGKGQTK